MAFNFFVRKKDIQEQVEPQKNSLIDADLLLIQIGLMQQTYFSLAKTRSGKGEPRGYCRALKDIEAIIRDMKDTEVAK
ncbi:Hypothetical protein TFLO_2891 [Trichococcus flocculiformis]|uniref:Uncharacterized protein n=1 Tax=Trichococcus flocculiformis TaxID=82803 RepID=A0AB38BLB6_9LACT|nr:hypothetical protein [Trichococcus flocculiformis]CZR04021.1 Hypothetical protein TFLO_2891 [Trichococcus flocculiformis]SFI16898.1 hypothetical protein SAMN04488507_106423 [Trichococcus flocculiformis]